MAISKPESKVVVIGGATASGKSGLAIKLAKEFNGEIISADSLTAYKRMDIGTAKPTTKDKGGIKHWGFDLVGPGERFTAANFKDYALEKITNIQSRGKLPIVVGGTGLYIDALVFNYSFGGDVDLKQRQKLEALSTKELQTMIKAKQYEMPFNHQNRRHLVRLLERQGQTGTKHQIPKDWILVGLMPEPEKLKPRINQRVDAMFNDGLIAETRQLVKSYGADSLIAKAKVAYGPIVDMLDGKLTENQAQDHLKVVHWQYARRQRTWMKRSSHLNLFDNPQAAHTFIRYKLTKKSN